MAKVETQLFRFCGTTSCRDKVGTERDVIEWFKTNCDRWIFQAEVGDGGYRHWQSAFQLKARTRKLTLAKAMRGTVMEGTHLSEMSDEKASFDYSTKAETRVDGPWSSEDTEMPPELKDTKLSAWQQQVHDDLISPCTPAQRRIVSCIVDPLGGAGKSFLQKWMRWRKLAAVLPPISKAEDILAMVMCMPIKNGYVIDIPRGENPKKLAGMWTAIETIKSGYAYDKRYKFRDVSFASPKVWCFMNWMPDMGVLSRDRWDIWLMHEGRLVQYTEARLTKVAASAAKKAAEHMALGPRGRVIAHDAIDDSVVEN